MKVLLRNPAREIEVAGRRNVNALLAELGSDDVVEIRPVISGGA